MFGTDRRAPDVTILTYRIIGRLLGAGALSHQHREGGQAREQSVREAERVHRVSRGNGDELTSVNTVADGRRGDIGAGLEMP
jgi:hypothetical protein